MLRFPQIPLPLLALALAVGGMPLAAGSLRAADTEVRDFSIRIDNKPAGEYHMTITRNDDGTMTMIGQADVRVTFYLVKTYTYTYRGTEIWKDGRLMRLDCNANDDGTRYTVSAVAEKDGLRVRANGQEKMSRADVWLTTYWRLPDAKQRNQALPLLDADTGKDVNASLQYVGPAQVNVGGQLQNVSHWRLSGGVKVELWFDGAERLVRQEWVEDGHTSLLEITRIRK